MLLKDNLPKNAVFGKKHASFFSAVIKMSRRSPRRSAEENEYILTPKAVKALFLGLTTFEGALALSATNIREGKEHVYNSEEMLQHAVEDLQDLGFQQPEINEILCPDASIRNTDIMFNEINTKNYPVVFKKEEKDGEVIVRPYLLDPCRGYKDRLYILDGAGRGSKLRANYRWLYEQFESVLGEGSVRRESLKLAHAGGRSVASPSRGALSPAQSAIKVLNPHTMRIENGQYVGTEISFGGDKFSQILKDATGKRTVTLANGKQGEKLYRDILISFLGQVKDKSGRPVEKAVEYSKILQTAVKNGYFGKKVYSPISKRWVDVGGSAYLKLLSEDPGYLRNLSAEEYRTPEQLEAEAKASKAQKEQQKAGIRQMLYVKSPETGRPIKVGDKTYMEQLKLAYEEGNQQAINQLTEGLTDQELEIINTNLQNYSAYVPSERRSSARSSPVSKLGTLPNALTKRNRVVGGSVQDIRKALTTKPMGRASFKVDEQLGYPQKHNIHPRRGSMASTVVTPDEEVALQEEGKIPTVVQPSRTLSPPLSVHSLSPSRRSRSSSLSASSRGTSPVQSEEGEYFPQSSVTTVHRTGQPPVRIPRGQGGKSRSPSKQQELIPAVPSEEEEEEEEGAF